MPKELSPMVYCNNSAFRPLVLMPRRNKSHRIADLEAAGSLSCLHDAIDEIIDVYAVHAGARGKGVARWYAATIHCVFDFVFRWFPPARRIAMLRPGLEGLPRHFNLTIEVSIFIPPEIALIPSVSFIQISLESRPHWLA